MEDGKRKKYAVYVIYALIALGIILALQLVSPFSPGKISYSEFLSRLDAGQISKATITQSVIEGTFIEGEGAKETEFTTERIPDYLINDLINEMEVKGVDFSGKIESTFMRDIFISWILPLGFILLIYFLLIRRLFRKGGVGGGMGALSFGQSKVKIYDRSRERITFEEVAGLDEAKQELVEIIDFLKNPAKYRKLGARIPKGVLLVGPPGTGKTLLAKAVAGEADVPFFSISGSQFMEMFVGVGAARVRDVFEQAKEKAPCIVFIDEIDTIGKVRGGIASSGGTEEREQTLNQLLSEMDGFEPQTGVIILAATNRPEVLDPSILRPGRFDRQIAVDRPDIKGREAILKVHARNVKLAPDVDLKLIAARTPGFAGSDLANVVNEAALMAARRDRESVLMVDFEEALDRVIGGLELKSRIMSEKERRVVAYHEVGHALAATLLEHADKVHRITVIPRGIGSLGMTMQLPEEDRYIITRSELEDRLAVLMGGRAAEEIIFGELSTGAQNDLEKATMLAHRMIENFGMSDVLGPISLGTERGAKFLVGDYGLGSERDYSDSTAEIIDQEIKRILTDNYERVKGMLEERRDSIEGITEVLLEKETLEGDEFRELMIKYHLPVNHDSDEAETGPGA
jgi:cell division protease FtsH